MSQTVGPPAGWAATAAGVAALALITLVAALTGSDAQQLPAAATVAVAVAWEGVAVLWVRARHSERRLLRAKRVDRLRLAVAGALPVVVGSAALIAIPTDQPVRWLLFSTGLLLAWELPAQLRWRQARRA
jgi:hypothetical protein